MTLEEYIMVNYDNDPFWFEAEVNNPYHTLRIANVYANKDYLRGQHNVLNREDMQYKGQAYITNKTLLNYAKTVIRFHDTFLLGKPVSYSGDDKTVKTLTDIAKLGSYAAVDYKILDRVLKYGDAYEVVYQENGIIKSKVLDSGDSYPIYDNGEYLGFIEHWTDAYKGISYYNVYYDSYVDYWSNEGGELHKIDSQINVCGLPIHWHNFSDDDECFGKDMLNDIIPIMDDLEDMMSKLSDSVYTLTLNPMPVAIGQRIDSSIPADATGYVLNLDAGSFTYANAQMDYNTIQLYLDNVKKWLADISCIPSVLTNGNVANVSEVSIRLLFHMANLLADENKKWLDIGYRERFNKFSNMLKMQGIESLKEATVIYNIDIPSATTETTANLQALKQMGAISTETIMEKSDLIADKDAEMKRVKKEDKKREDKQKEQLNQVNNENDKNEDEGKNVEE